MFDVQMAIIKISDTSEDICKKYKHHPDESLESVVERIIHLMDKEDTMLTIQDRLDIKKGAEQVKNGQVITHEEMLVAITKMNKL